MIRPAGITGIGVSLPDAVLTNSDLEKMVETSDEWIRTRTGISERRIAAPGKAASDLASEAALGAIASAGISPSDIDLIIVATVTPDMPFPATACIVQDKIGASRAAAFDLEAACSGFIYAMTVGAQFIETGMYETVLVIGSETLSRIINWKDRSTCVLMGDGAGAVVLQQVPEGYGLLGSYLGADGSGADLLKVPGGGSRCPASLESVVSGEHFLKMNGSEVFKFAVRIIGEAAERVLEKSGLTFADVDCYIPHQANYRIIEASARKFGLPMERVLVNIDRYGNTSAASIPIALFEGFQTGRISAGDIVLMVAFGGGLTWGASVMRWVKGVSN